MEKLFTSDSTNVFLSLIVGITNETKADRRHFWEIYKEHSDYLFHLITAK